MKDIIERLLDLADGNKAYSVGELWNGLEEAVDEITSLRFRLAGLEGQEPVAIEFQHEETGQIGSVDLQQVEWGFFKNNPRLQEIGPLYRHPAPPAVPERLLSRAEEQIELLLLDADQYEDMESFDLAADAVRTVGVIRDLMNALKREGGAE